MRVLAICTLVWSARNAHERGSLTQRHVLRCGKGSVWVHTRNVSKGLLGGLKTMSNFVSKDCANILNYTNDLFIFLPIIYQASKYELPMPYLTHWWKCAKILPTAYLLLSTVRMFYLSKYPSPYQSHWWNLTNPLPNTYSV